MTKIASRGSCLNVVGGGGGGINIACVLCGCFTGESWLKTEKNERDKEIKQYMCTISPLCDVFFPFYLFIYLFIFGGGGGVLCCVKVFHWRHKKEKKEEERKKEM